LRLLALLGQRLGEVSSMTTSELSLSGEPTWSLPAARTKNKLPHVIPLPPLSVEIVKRQVLRGQFVFPSRLVTPQAIEGSTLSARFSDLARDLAFNPEETPRHQRATLHTLRHTMKTNLAQLGVPDNISDRVTNQVTGQRARVGSRYDHHTYLDEKRRALELWEQRLIEIVEDRPSSGLKW
jgi:integrase